MQSHALKKNKQGYTRLFNNIDLTIKGGHATWCPNTKNKIKMFC